MLDWPSWDCFDIQSITKIHFFFMMLTEMQYNTEHIAPKHSWNRQNVQEAGQEGRNNHKLLAWYLLQYWHFAHLVMSWSELVLVRCLVAVFTDQLGIISSYQPSYQSTQHINHLGYFELIPAKTSTILNLME